VEIKTEADSNDMTDCSHDDKPTTGVFHFPDSIFSAFILFVVLALLSCCFVYNWIALPDNKYSPTSFSCSQRAQEKAI